MPDIIITPSSGIIDFYPVSTRVGRIDGSGNSLNITNPSGYVILSSSGLSVNSSSPNATLFAYSATSGATLLNVEGTNGSLFSVVDNLSGTLMSVNNNAGLPVFEVFSDDRVVAGRFGQNDFIMTSGGNVGIGTGVPSSKFHVVGTSTFNGDISSTGSFIGGSGTAALPSFEFINDPDTGLFSPATNTFGITTSGVERLRINNVGNVGIGLDSPVEKLDVLGNVKIAGANTSLTIAQDDTTTMRMRSAGNLIVGAGSAANVRFLISTTEHARLSDQGRFGIGLVSPSGKLGVAGGATIGSNYNITPPTNGLIVEGNVGIGTTTPTSQLHVIGTGNFTQALQVNGTGVSISGHTHTASNITDFNSSVSGLFPSTIIYATGVQSISGVKTFYNRPVFNSGIQVNNRITSADGAYIDIYDTIEIRSAETNIVYDASLGEGFNVVDISTSVSKISIADSIILNGNVGVGATIPISQLHVIGSGLFSGDVTANGSLIGGSGTSLSPSFKFANDPDTGSFSPAANTFAISTSGVERLRVDSIGRVGIGTTSPTSLLHVSGEVRVDGLGKFVNYAWTPAIEVDGGAKFGKGNVGYIYFGDDAFGSELGFYTNNEEALATKANGSFHYGGGTPSNGRIIVTSIGNVGIGTSEPGSPLTISSSGAAGTIGGAAQTRIFQVNDASFSDYVNLGHFNCEGGNSRGSFMLSNNNTNGAWEDNVLQFLTHGAGYPYGYYGGNLSDAGCAMIVTQGSEITKLQIGNYNAAPIEFFTDNTFRVRIDTSGNVGIGTATPTEELDVNGSININGYIKHTFNAADYSNGVIAPIIWFNINNDINTEIAKIDVAIDNTPSEGMLVFHTNDGSSLQERVRITDVGNVGIGTIAPTVKLDVIGDIKTNSNLKINDTSLSESQLINIINGGNLYLWSNFR